MTSALAGFTKNNGLTKLKVEKFQRLLLEISNLVRTESSEVLFKEGAEQYWIMVQKPLLKPLFEEAKPRQMIDASVIWLGAVKAKDSLGMADSHERIPCTSTGNFALNSACSC